MKACKDTENSMNTSHVIGESALQNAQQIDILNLR
jgi:hypothetical protein